MNGPQPSGNEPIHQRKFYPTHDERRSIDLGCGATPNCVSSEADDSRRSVLAFDLVSGRDVAWTAVRDQAALLPGATVVAFSTTHIHVECRSRVFRFVDDLELCRCSGLRRISVRSASRIGYSDFGTNRRRIERLRRRLRKQGLIH